MDGGSDDDASPDPVLLHGFPRGFLADRLPDFLRAGDVLSCRDGFMYVDGHIFHRHVRFGAAGEGECAVCLKGYEAADRPRTMPRSHGFHERCIFRWLCVSHVCPLCRFKLPATEEEEREFSAASSSSEAHERRRRDFPADRLLDFLRAGYKLSFQDGFMFVDGHIFHMHVGFGAAGEGECAVCLEGDEAGDRPRTMPCSHGFHESCIFQCLRVSRVCPLCHFKLPAAEEEEPSEFSAAAAASSEAHERHCGYI